MLGELKSLPKDFNVKKGCPCSGLYIFAGDIVQTLRMMMYIRNTHLSKRDDLNGLILFCNLILYPFYSRCRELKCLNPKFRMKVSNFAICLNQMQCLEEKRGVFVKCCLYEMD